MEISKCFLDILQSIDYHVGHLPKDLFANEVQLPELLPIFTWFINNVTPNSNCVTPKELALYEIITSRYDHSTEDISKAIDKFYDKSTKDSTVCSSDLESLEEQILKTQHELNELKGYRELYKKKTKLIDKEICILKESQSHTNVYFYEIENDLAKIMNTFNEKIDLFGFNIEKLHNNVNNSMTNNDECLPKVASNNLINLTSLWHQQISKMINTWFKNDNLLDDKEDKYSIKITSLLQSVTDLRLTEITIKYDIEKLNVAINNIFNFIQYYTENYENLHTNGINIQNYLLKYVNNQNIPIEHLKSIESDGFQSSISDIVIGDSKKKCLELEKINDRITFVQDSLEHYIITCDVLWCLMRTGFSMANFKCELVIHSINVLEKMLCDITNDNQYTFDWIENNTQTSHTRNVNRTIYNDNVLVKFDKYKCFSHIYNSRDEIEKLSKIILQWKNKYHYSRVECNRLTILQSKLQMFSNTINELSNKVLI